jgi:hypothetical protein
MTTTLFQETIMTVVKNALARVVDALMLICFALIASFIYMAIATPEKLEVAVPQIVESAHSGWDYLNAPTP